MTHSGARIWIVETSGLDAGAVAKFERSLSEDERTRAYRFRREENRREFTAAHALTRAALAHVAGCDPTTLTFTAGKHGKPAVAGPTKATSLAFSLSHTEGLVGVAVANAAVGFDLENMQTRHSTRELHEAVLTEAERRALHALPDLGQAERFFRLWTLKEAYMKARGLGLHIDPRKVSVEVEGERARLTEPAGEDAVWSVTTSIVRPGFAMGVCQVIGSGTPVTEDGVRVLRNS